MHVGVGRFGVTVAGGDLLQQFRAHVGDTVTLHRLDGRGGTVWTGLSWQLRPSDRVDFASLFLGDR